MVNFKKEMKVECANELVEASIKKKKLNLEFAP